MTSWHFKVALGWLLVMATVIFGAWRFESVIRNGRIAFIPLLPVDPRAPLLGDYMQLNYGLGEELNCAPAEPPAKPCAQTGTAQLELNERSIGTALRHNRVGASASGNTIALRYRLHEGRVVYGNGQAFFFTEGAAERFVLARFAEFRIADDGRAVLVGLRGENLEELQ